MPRVIYTDTRIEIRRQIAQLLEDPTISMDDVRQIVKARVRRVRTVKVRPEYL
jgi:hypothetical protein